MTKRRTISRTARAHQRAASAPARHNRKTPTARTAAPASAHPATVKTGSKRPASLIPAPKLTSEKPAHTHTQVETVLFMRGFYGK